MSAKKTEMLWTRRKMLARVGLGSAVGMVLAACGGGGDDSSGDAQVLVDAFAKLENGLVWTDVERLVGFPANSLRTDVWLIWVVDGAELSVSFYSTDSKTITSATFKPRDAVSQTRDFD